MFDLSFTGIFLLSYSTTQVVPMWLSHLPIKEDLIEAKEQPMSWLKNKTDFYALAEDLQTLGFIPKSDISLLATHFVFFNESKQSLSTTTPEKIRDGSRKIRNKEQTPSEEFKKIAKAKLHNTG